MRINELEYYMEKRTKTGGKHCLKSKSFSAGQNYPKFGTNKT